MRILNLRLPDPRCVVVLCVLAAAPLPARAIAVTTVTEPWVRVAPNAKSAEIYMVLRSSEGGKLVVVRSEAGTEVPMQPPGASRATVSEIALPAGKLVKLAPGGYRLAVFALDRKLSLGDRVPLVLIVEAADGSRTEIPISAEVRLRSPTEDHKRGHAH
jgi:copper(I)-binding protein